MERKYSEEAGRRSCASSPACADVVIGRVCLEVMVYESACGVGLLLGAAPSCQLPPVAAAPGGAWFGCASEGEPSGRYYFFLRNMFLRGAAATG